MEIILVGVLLVMSKLVEIYCSKMKASDVKKFFSGAIIMFFIFILVYVVGFYSRGSEQDPITDLDIMIAFGASVIVSLGIGFKCMLSED